MKENLFDLTGKVALITGVSSGLGQQFARTLAAAGANLAIVARRRKKLEEVKEKLEKEFGIEVFVEPCDVMRTSDIRSSVQKIRAHFGKIDILINNAGVGAAFPSSQHPDDEWHRIINTNLNAVFFFCREVGVIMLQQKYGKIINLGSIHSRVAMPNMPIAAYAASKGGVFMLTKALATEWAEHGITVNAIGPSYFKSEMTKTLVNNPDFLKTIKGLCPMGRVGNVGELDGAILFFASDASSFTTGQLLNIDGGWTAI
ncbi:SDR family oxidoreductase [Microgenomates group bacterium]|nr:SDR family oxidoreductase [Microgenomates group bacterium]